MGSFFPVWHTSCLSNRQMLPSSHVIPIKGSGPDSLPNPQLLADAFSEFISASSVLEASYRDLQQEVSRLSAELTKRNAALSSSLADNDRMRVAVQQMLDSMPCGVLVLNYENRIVMTNPEGRRLLDLGATAVQSLRELSGLNGVDFEAISANSGNRQECEICIQSCSQSGEQKR